jgi:hypothetical protein
MRCAGVLFFWVLCCLSTSYAAGKNSLPNGEDITQCLMRQASGGFVPLTTDTLQKKPLQLLLEEWIALDGRQNPAGKKMDQAPDTKPNTSLPDIAPRLTSDSLYHDLSAANAHWEAFLDRRPVTGWYLQKYADRPQLKLLYDGDVKEYAKALAARNMIKGYRDQRQYLTTMGAALLYADFLSARGDITAKEKAVNLLSATIFFLNSGDQFSDKELARRATLEMTWSLLDPRMHLDLKPIYDVFYKALTQHSEEKLRLEKWIVNHTPGGAEQDVFKKTLLLSRANSYIEQKDPMGGLFCIVAATQPQEWKVERLQSVRSLLANAFGFQRGEAEYRRFLESILSDETRVQVTRELEHLKATVHPTPTK